MSKINETARLFAHTLIEHEKKKGEITEEVIEEVVSRLSAMNIVPGESIDENELFDILISDLSIGAGSITLLSEDIDPWLNDEKTNIEFDLWKRYKMLLQKRDPSFPVNELDDFTDKILDKCVNPKQLGSWDRRGMVVGHVQSGKTSNYVGLINKATDAGYKVIIVIAGTISSLRRQTQERIDDGYIGRNSSAYLRNKGENRIKGVGEYKVDTDIYPLTSSYYKKGDEGDFNTKVANSSNIPIGKNPVVFVIKKNKTILENLIDWFSINEEIKLIDGKLKLMNVPALIIDDESDYASVNATKDINEVKTINRLIRVLLNLFDQNTFIGYTATPYANLFISQEYNEELTTYVKGKEYFVGNDLFPKDFIINIKAAKNYIGAAKMFGLEDPITGESNEPLPVFRPIYSDEYNPPLFEKINKKNKDNLPEYIPESLEKAIMSFVLTCAVRRVRGHKKKHNSMLIHVALYVIWIDRISLLVNEKIKEFKNKIEANDIQFIEKLKRLYLDDFVPTTRIVSENLDYIDKRIKVDGWEDVKSELRNSILKIDVRAVHGTTSTSKLDYHNISNIDYERHENGLNVIAVGGGKLSRGITLEGLSTSYYLRTTKMYDSLMQMGRWFGYRPGYVDLCRLFTNNRIFDWFNHITMATEEMRNDFDIMTSQNLKPKDFRLKVRNHHGLLAVTSVSKLYWSKDIKISFSGTNLQTYLINKDLVSIKNNQKILADLSKKLSNPIVSRIRDRVKYLMFNNVNEEHLTSFIYNYKINIPAINNSVIADYITSQKSISSIKEWTIVIVSNTDKNVKVFKNGDGKGDKMNVEPTRYNLIVDGHSIEMVCSVRNQTEPNEKYKITKNQIDDIKDRQVDLKVKGFTSNKLIKEQRAKEKKGLLLIYALDERGTSNLENNIPIVGYSIHFPEIENEQKTSYTATIFDDFDEDLMGEEDNNIKN
ncbi:Z1 domain-containing protein [Lutibacter flavus]|uniref:Z1 domain-containing protein n=1 Tax=Lutibacter flavus TaxID=691689 RepID=A0A238XJD9_9FLAO|nr:Z1 domain-containing protein [Lutibacter flavus]SNR58812.1 Z1 domain-containing protein [Lutibacter flavus]